MQLMRLKDGFNNEFDRKHAFSTCELATGCFENRAVGYNLMATRLFYQPPIYTYDEDGLLLQLQPYIVDQGPRYLVMSLLFWPQEGRAQLMGGLAELPLRHDLEATVSQKINRQLDERGYEVVADPWLGAKLLLVQQAHA